MIAYSHKSLDNLSIHDEIASALNNHLISKEEAKAIKEKYPVNLYTPNLFIRIGLFLLTVLITFMSLGLLAFLGGSFSEKDLGGLMLFFAIGTYAVLEVIIRQKAHYRSGIDDALLCMSMGFLFASINIIFSFPTPLSESVFVFILSGYCLLRFGNAIMSGIAFISFLAIIFYTVLRLGIQASLILPFLMMGLSFLVYWVTRKVVNNNRLRHYRNCIIVVQVLSLVIFYAAGNYFVVQEFNNEMFATASELGRPVWGAWLFWILTVVIPLTYIFRGLQKKNIILLRTGLVLIAATVFTIRYYYYLASVDIIMTIAGMIMISVAYFVTKLLATPKHGFTQTAPNDPQIIGLRQLESLAIAQTFHDTGADTGEHFQFGGGSTGGGGASEKY